VRGEQEERVVVRRGNIVEGSGEEEREGGGGVGYESGRRGTNPTQANHFLPSCSNAGPLHNERERRA
jgi:hypothetical protein